MATLIVEITVEGDDRRVLHENTVLVRADSPEQAYERAIELGIQHDCTDKNPAGAVVDTRFRGLAHLLVVHDELEHGAELWWSERVGASDQDIASLICRKDELEVFTRIAPTAGPDYSSRDVVDAVNSELSKRDR